MKAPRPADFGKPVRPSFDEMLDTPMRPGVAFGPAVAAATVELTAPIEMPDGPVTAVLLRRPVVADYLAVGLYDTGSHRNLARWLYVLADQPREALAQLDDADLMRLFAEVRALIEG